MYTYIYTSELIHRHIYAYKWSNTPIYKHICNTYNFNFPLGNILLKIK